MSEPPAPEVADRVDSEDAPGTGSEADFVHESVELPGWVPVAFGLTLVGIAALAIWMA